MSPLPQYAFMAWCSVKKKHWDTFTKSPSIFRYCFYIFI